MASPAYRSRAYRAFKQTLAARYIPCALQLPGCTDRADTPDHDPPLALHRHVEGTGCCQLRPACRACNAKIGCWRVANIRMGRRVRPLPTRRPPPASRHW